MLRVMTFYNKRPDMTYDKLKYEIMDVHVPMVAKLPGLKRYQQSFNVNWPPSEDGLAYDGIAELWFETGEAHQSAMSQAQEPLAHAAEILDMDTLRSMVVKEHPITLQTAAPSSTHDLIRYMTFYNKRSDMTYDEFKREVMDIHVPMVAKLPGLKRYQQNFNVNLSHVGNSLAYDGIAELWFESHDAYQAAMSVAQEPLAHAAEVLDTDTLRGMAVRENPVPLATG